jgi:glycosyltransferase involved in cell wall biosynthesis|tara:strand:+ start:1867 stop:2016 length:150 start_codon:yes stop_codon:yes gene_type:complete
MKIKIYQIFTKKLNYKIDILFVDDNSTDGTRKENLKNKSVNYIFRPKET